jgi:predicted protein tyrosine phosphatase
MSAVSLTVSRSGAAHLLTCLHDDVQETPATIQPDRHLRLVMHDIAEAMPDYTAPNVEHIERLIDFAQAWGGHDAMVVHCWAGISRSTAAAFISLCTINPDAPEELIARRLREASPTAYPNRLMVRLADQALARRGRMIDAVERIGRGELASEAIPFSLAADVMADASR